MQGIEYRFAGFAVLPAERRLIAQGAEAKIGARAFDLLVALLERRHRLVGKAELFDLVWRGQTVEEGNLQVQINALRKLLGAQAIATAPGRGYRFAAQVEVVGLPTEFHGNVVARAATLYGRQADVAALDSAIDRDRLVTVTGAGGIGKTRLAEAVAELRRQRHRDGVWIVELAALTDADLIAGTVARALGHPVGPKPHALPILAEAMRAQDLLLVLDNCEHLVEAVATLVAAILNEAPRVRLIVTSQEPLRLAVEKIYRLAPLAAPAEADLATAADYGAVALFVARAQGSDPRFALNSANVGAVVEICQKLDGVPLALELAAARTPLLGAEGVRQRLDERFRLLVGAERDALPRHRALRAALEWSYAMLSVRERAALDRLGVFAGGFGLGAALALVGEEGEDEWARLDRLGALVDKSLVSVEGGDPPRYRLLESTRAFALERLEAVGEIDEARRRHARALVDSFASAAPLESVSARLIRIAPDLSNVRAAAAWAVGPTGDRDLAVQIYGEADNLWMDAGAVDEGEALFRCAAPWVGEAAPAVAARFWLARASLLLLRAVREGAAAGLKAAEIYRALGDREGLFRALIAAGVQLAMDGAYEDAQSVIAEAQSLRSSSWPAWTLGRIEQAKGFADLWSGRAEAARSHFRRALDLFRRPDGDAFYETQTALNVARCEYDIGDYEALERGCREFLAHAQSPAGRRHAAATFAVHTSFYLGVAQARLGDLKAAETTLRVAAPRLKRAWGVASWTFGPVAYLLARQGRAEDAAQLLGWLDATRKPGMVVASEGHRRAAADAAVLVEHALGSDAFAEARSQGASFDDDAAFAVAFPV